MKLFKRKDSADVAFDSAFESAESAESGGYTDDDSDGFADAGSAGDDLFGSWFDQEAAPATTASRRNGGRTRTRRPEEPRMPSEFDSPATQPDGAPTAEQAADAQTSDTFVTDPGHHTDAYADTFRAHTDTADDTFRADTADTADDTFRADTADTTDGAWLPPAIDDPVWPGADGWQGDGDEASSGTPAIDLDGPLDDSPFTRNTVAGNPLPTPPSAGPDLNERESDVSFAAPAASEASTGTDAVDDPDESGDGPNEPAAVDGAGGASRAKRRSRALIAGGVAVLLALVAAIVISALDTDEGRRQGATVLETTTTEVSTTGLAPTTTSMPGAPLAPGATVAQQAPGSWTTANPSIVTQAAAPPTTPNAEVTTLQVVPVMRNVIVIVNGHSYASAADGTIVLAPGDRHSAAQIVGLNTTPALQQAQFTGWGDGDTRATRPLDSINGPLAQIGVNVLDRVQVVAGSTPFGGATVTFSSPLGQLDLEVGQPQWVVTTRAKPTPAGLMPDPISYTAVRLTKDAVVSPLQPLQFQPTPEAIWVVM